MQVFGDTMSGTEKCESCDRGAGPFQGCHRLCAVNEQDPPILSCGNCAYSGDRSCIIGDGKQYVSYLICTDVNSVQPKSPRLKRQQKRKRLKSPKKIP